MLFKTMMFLAAFSFLVFIDPLVAAAAAFAIPMIMILLVAMVAMVAVWSRNEARRKDAQEVLLILLDYFFQQRKK
ncbi:hypothetical protein ACFW9F_24400 [Streptomyces sp. NPDC059506]|uniref:hypothetical protein n=1 Tax=Streptomyces sp. NPDC059506 TaxID=3347751 RepID=UPI0036A101B9